MHAQRISWCVKKEDKKYKIIGLKLKRKIGVKSFFLRFFEQKTIQAGKTSILRAHVQI